MVKGSSEILKDYEFTWLSTLDMRNKRRNLAFYSLICIFATQK